MKLPYDLYIVLDTNVFYDDLEMKGKKFQALRYFLNKTHSRVIMPSIIKDELAKKYKEQTSRDFSRLQRIIQNYDGLLEIKDTEDNILRKYDEKLKRLGYSFIDFDSTKIDIKLILDRSLGEKPPFGKSDKGFRDSVIWESTLAHVRKTGGVMPLALVTANSSDFGVGELAEELKNDAQELGIDTFYYTSLEELLKKHSEPISFIDDEAVEAIVESNLSYLESVAEDSEGDLIEHVDRYALDEFGKDIEDVEISGQPSYVGHSTYSYYIYDEDDDYIYVDAEVEVEVEFEAEYSYRIREYDDEDYDYGTHYGSKYLTDTVSTTIPMRFSKETKTGEMI